MKEEAKERIKQINIKLGNNLLKARLAAGFSRTQLSKRVYLAQQQIDKYEKATNAIPIGRLVLILEALEVDLLSFLSDIYRPIEKIKGSKKLCRTVARNFMKIKSKDQQQILNRMIQDIIDSQNEPTKE